MASKVFLDANIMLEYFLGREKKDEVREIFLLIENGTIKAFTSVSIIQTCGYILLKSYNKLVTRQILMGMIKTITIIDCMHATVVLALNSSISDLEDATQYYSALQHNMEYYLTFDKKLIKQSTSQLPVLSPADFLNH
jgi:predicted nucleic acid-binding protein